MLRACYARMNRKGKGKGCNVGGDKGGIWDKTGNSPIEMGLEGT